MSFQPESFRAPFISKEQAWKAADDFREKHWPGDGLPVDVEQTLWTVGLRLEPVQSLKTAGDIDALLLGDLSAILVDAEEYMDDRMQNRIRYSIAHELGHFVLHRAIYRGMNAGSVEEWIETVQRIPEDQYSYIEQHAYEFAGRLLVPLPLLRERLREAAERARKVGFVRWDSSGDAAREFVASALCKEFGVSSQVLEKRIMRENLWPPSVV